MNLTGNCSKFFLVNREAAYTRSVAFFDNQVKGNTGNLNFCQYMKIWWWPHPYRKTYDLQGLADFS